MTTIMFTPNGIYFGRISTQALVQRAFGIEDDDRILGLPGWAKSDSLDIQAKVDELNSTTWRGLSRDQQRPALVALLTSRFDLKFHHEKRVQPALCLIVAKNGPKLKKAKPGESYSNGVQGPDGPRGGGTIWSENGKIIGQGVPVSDLAALLSFQQRLGHTVADKTGLTGKYDFTLDWSLGDAPVPNSGGPSLFTVLQEQLGLKLQAQKSLVDVIVIDHIDRPSEN